MRTQKQTQFVGLLILTSVMVGSVATADAKSLYAITKHYDYVLTAYELEGEELKYQTTAKNLPSRPSGPIGLALDPDSETLFITYEKFGLGLDKIELLSAKTMISEQGTRTIPGANSLAGIVYDQTKQKVYMVDRGTDKLFVYLWDPAVEALTPDGDNPKTLANLLYPYAYGIALDETRGHLCVTNATNIVRYYDTNDPNFAYLGSIEIIVDANDREAVGIAFDPNTGCLYTGSFIGYGGDHTCIVRTDLTDINEPCSTQNDIGTYVIGLTVDAATGLLYVTTENNHIEVYNTNTWPSDACSVVDANILDPADIIVRGDVMYKPPRLGLEKDDDVNDCVYPNDEITYTISYDAKGWEANNVTLTDRLADEVDFNSASEGYSYDFTSRTVTWDLNDLGPTESDSVTLTVNVREFVDSIEPVTNLCEIESDRYYTGLVSAD
ncbi:MAG: hypothetical protein ACYTEL_23205, partial [Planctomycetota bacterium]